MNTTIGVGTREFLRHAVLPMDAGAVVAVASHRFVHKTELARYVPAATCRKSCVCPAIAGAPFMTAGCAARNPPRVRSSGYAATEIAGHARDRSPNGWRDAGTRNFASVSVQGGGERWNGTAVWRRLAYLSKADSRTGLHEFGGGEDAALSRRRPRFADTLMS
jgi:hypothetical protein